MIKPKEDTALSRLMIERIVAGHHPRHLRNAARAYGIEDLEQFKKDYSEQITFAILKR